MESPDSRAPVDLLVVIDEFAIGGVASLYSTIVSQASSKGHSVMVVGRPGPAREALEWGGATTVEVATWDRSALDQLDTLITRAQRVVWQTSPLLVPFFVSFLQKPGTTLVVHGSAAVTRPWLGDDLVHLLATALSARSSTQVMVPSHDLVRELGALLSLPTERLRVLSHVSRPYPSASPARSRPRPRVVVPTRISEEKRFIIRAGLGLALARGLPLTVVGDGNDVAWVQQLGQDSGAEVEVIQDPRIHEHVCADDVVVAVGLVALEAVRYCGALVSAARDGGILGVVTPETARDLYAANFLGATEAYTPDEAWRLIEGLTETDRDRIRTRIESLADPARAYDQLVAACDEDPGRLDPDRLADLASATSRAWVAQSSADKAWIAHLVEARDWLTEHRAELEAWAAELDRNLTLQRERADDLERRCAVLLQQGER